MEKVDCSVSYIWHRILKNLEDKIGVVAVSSWLDQTEAVSFDGHELVLREKSAFRREVITIRASSLIQEAAHEEFQLDIQVVLREE